MILRDTDPNRRLNCVGETKKRTYQIDPKNETIKATVLSPPADRRHEMNLAGIVNFFQQPHRGHHSVNSDRDIGLELIIIE